MPDFELQVTGATVVPWTDEGDADRPSRLNQREGCLSRRYSADVGDVLALVGVVDGVVAPLDAALDGRLFHASTIDSVCPYPVGFSSPVGQSSVQSFQPLVAGHYCVYLRREDSGSIIVHIDAEAA